MSMSIYKASSLNCPFHRRWLRRCRGSARYLTRTSRVRSRQWRNAIMTPACLIRGRFAVSLRNLSRSQICLEQRRKTPSWVQVLGMFDNISGPPRHYLTHCGSTGTCSGYDYTDTCNPRALPDFRFWVSAPGSIARGNAVHVLPQIAQKR